MIDMTNFKPNSVNVETVSITQQFVIVSFEFHIDDSDFNYTVELPYGSNVRHWYTNDIAHGQPGNCPLCGENEDGETCWETGEHRLEIIQQLVDRWGNPHLGVNAPTFPTRMEDLRDFLGR